MGIVFQLLCSILHLMQFHLEMSMSPAQISSQVCVDLTAETHEPRLIMGIAVSDVASSIKRGKGYPVI